MAETYDFAQNFQDAILACVITHPEKFIRFGNVLESRYFLGVQSTITADCAFEYYKENGRFPSWEILEQLALNYQKRLGGDDAGARDRITDYVISLKEIDTGDVDFVSEQVVAFARERATLAAIKASIADIQEGKIDHTFIKRLEDALRVGQDLEDLGYLLHRDAEKAVRKITDHQYGIRTGFHLLDDIWRNGLAPGWLVILLAPPKRYKCLGKGTGIIMFDGSVKKVEDIVIGDVLMGDDSTPRNVTSCGQGRGPLYRITQSNGEDFVCNDAHILCVKSPNGSIREITAEDYFKEVSVHKSYSYRRQWQAYKVGVEFPDKPTSLDPYFLGLWLGDGVSRGPEIAVGDGDDEIREFLLNYSNQLGMRVKKKLGQGCCSLRFKKKPLEYRNFITAALRSLDLLQNKHIPDCFKLNSRNRRLRLLAGLIDSDGSLIGRRLQFVNTNKKLIDDTCWLARSLGLRAYITKFKTTCQTGKRGLAWRVEIGGNISEIPTLLPRKRCKNSEKLTDRSIMTITPMGEGDYYGFTIDGNRRFLLKDFTVTHNTAMCLNLAVNMISPAIGESVFYYTCEISQELALARVLFNLTGMDQNYMFTSTEKFIVAAQEQIQRTVAGNLIIKGFASKSATIADMEDHAKTCIHQLGIVPKAIIIDYAETVADSDKTPSEHQRSASIYTEARAMGFRLGVPVIMPDRCNRETVSMAVPNMTSFQGAFQKAGIVDIAIGLCSTEAEYINNVLRAFVFVNRHGPAFQHIRGSVDPDTMQIELLERVAYEPSDETGKKRRRGGGVSESVPDELK